VEGGAPGSQIAAFAAVAKKHMRAPYRARRARAAHCEIGWRRDAPFRACGAEKASMEPISMSARENIVDLGGLPRRRRRPERLPKRPVA
jgi:hypothetical protein